LIILKFKRKHREESRLRYFGGLKLNIFICNPSGMVATLQELLKDLGLPENQIKKEEFLVL